MSLKLVKRAINLALEQLEDIPESHFDYSSVMLKCGSQGCIMGHWGLNHTPDKVDEFVSWGNSLPLQEEFAKYLGINHESALFNFIVYGNDVKLATGTIHNDTDNNKATTIEKLNTLLNNVTETDADMLLDYAPLFEW